MTKKTISDTQRTNSLVADRLDEVAQILEEQKANVFRVGAYRHAATMLRGLTRPIDDLVRVEGLEGLQKLPGIGETLSRFIYQLVVSGRLPMLDRLRGESDPVGLLLTVPGIGKKTAERLHEQLGIDTLEELEIAAHDGRAARVAGIGEKRLAGIRDSLATRLGRVRTATLASRKQPSVTEILEVDQEYRQKSSEGLLPKITPRRFNPQQEKWLPILHTSRGERHYTALYSNTPKAHRLNKTSDWVVIYYDGGGGGERQCTVITSSYGRLAGKRIIRGREPECLEYYLHPIVRGVHSREIHNGFSI